MTNRLIPKFQGRQNMAYQFFVYVEEFKSSVFSLIGPYIFSIISRKNIKFQVKRYQLTLVSNLMEKYRTITCLEDENCVTSSED